MDEDLTEEERFARFQSNTDSDGKGTITVFWNNLISWVWHDFGVKNWFLASCIFSFPYTIAIYNWISVTYESFLVLVWF